MDDFYHILQLLEKLKCACTEGLLSECASATFEEVSAKPDQFARLKHSIGQKYRALEELFKHNGQRVDEIELNLWVMQRLMEAHIPELRKNPDFTIFWRNARVQRNNLFHRIGSLTQKQVLQAWGDRVRASQSGLTQRIRRI